MLAFGSSYKSMRPFSTSEESHFPANKSSSTMGYRSGQNWIQIFKVNFCPMPNPIINAIVNAASWIQMLCLMHSRSPWMWLQKEVCMRSSMRWLFVLMAHFVATAFECDFQLRNGSVLENPARIANIRRKMQCQGLVGVSIFSRFRYL